MTFRSSTAALARAALEVKHVIIVAAPGEVIAGDRRLAAQRHLVGDPPLRIGRTSGNDVMLGSPEVSRNHCMVAVEPGRGAVITDLGSTNGTFVNGQRLTAPVVLTDHSLIAVGSHTLLYRSGTAEQIARAETLEQEMERAIRYVRAVLPEPITTGPIRVAWTFQPSTSLGGDGFGYQRLKDGRFAVWLLDVVGHGVGSALLAVSIMNLLRQGELPGADPGDPAGVLARLNALYPMERHGDLCFSIWYAVFDPATRVLTHAAGGQHPAFLVEGTAPPRPLATRNMLLGSVPDIAFRDAAETIPGPCRIYLFSDGVFEVQGKDGRQRGLDDFAGLIAAAPEPGLAEPDRLLRDARAITDGAFDDDVSVLVVEID